MAPLAAEQPPNSADHAWLLPADSGSLSPADDAPRGFPLFVDAELRVDIQLWANRGSATRPAARLGLLAWS
jgi:hypothetical protein